MFDACELLVFMNGVLCGLTIGMIVVYVVTR